MHFELPEFSLKEKIALISIAILVVLIPVGTYVLSLRFKTQSSASTKSDIPRTNTKDASESSGLSDIKKLSQAAGKTSTFVSSTPEPTPEVFFGPTLGLKLSLEARPLSNQATRLFIGIANGTPEKGTTPQYIISYQVDVAATGETSGISLAGLTQGNTYTAYLKGQAQLATSSAFLLNPTTNDLGTIKMLTGDVNDDNVINQDDYNLVKVSVGSIPSSPKWNAIYDFNLDDRINTYDLGIISSHIGTSGESGVYKSTITSKPEGFADVVRRAIGGEDPTATHSATASALQTPNFNNPLPTPSSKPGGQEGYWIWLPKP